MDNTTKQKIIWFHTWKHAATAVLFRNRNGYVTDVNLVTFRAGKDIDLFKDIGFIWSIWFFDRLDRFDRIDQNWKIEKFWQEYTDNLCTQSNEQR